MDDLVNMVSFPLAKNKILVRIENLADIYDDNDSEKAVKKVQMDQLMTEMYQYSNNNYGLKPEIKIEELSLSGNMPITEMK